MKELVSAHTVANEVRMMRTQHKGALLVVEGPLDGRVYRRLVHQAACQIVVAHGKDNACGAIEILDDAGFKGVLAIVDADFDRLEERQPCSKNALLTDYHDLECMMMVSPAFAKVLAEYANASRLDAFERRADSTVATILAKNAMAIGYLRWFSLRQSLDLTFENLSYGKFTTRDDLDVNAGNLITEVKNKSQKHGLDESTIQSGIESLCSPEHDPWQVSCGHDIIELVSFGLRRTLAARNAVEVRAEFLQRSLRLAYEGAHFQDTRLYCSIRKWEVQNPRFRVLAS